MDLHSEVEKVVEDGICLLRLLETGRNCLLKLRDLARKERLDVRVHLCLAAGAFARKKSNNVVDARLDACTALLHFVEVGITLLERDGTLVDELVDRGAEAVRILNLLETIAW